MYPTLKAPEIAEAIVAVFEAVTADADENGDDNTLVRQCAAAGIDATGAYVALEVVHRKWPDLRNLSPEASYLVGILIGLRLAGMLGRRTL